MDYEKLYKEAFKRAKYYHDSDNMPFLENIFPELKESDDEKIRKALIQYITDKVSVILGWRKEELVAWLEKQGKQKSIDKVEPKFKKNDWITNGACTIKITSVDDRYYWHDNDCVGGDIESIDKEYHLWTIQDAKDGDVLVDNYAIIIFRKIGNYVSDDVVDFYICYSFEKGIIIQRHNLHCGSIDSIFFKPATKEQRELLFQKMKEAGYEWDDEKRELKKIEQNPAWSEDDEEKIRKMLIRIYKKADMGGEIFGEGITYKQVVAWLESLKPNHWKPSEEQMRVLQIAIKDYGICHEKSVLESLYNNLEKL